MRVLGSFLAGIEVACPSAAEAAALVVWRVAVAVAGVARGQRGVAAAVAAMHRFAAARAAPVLVLVSARIASADVLAAPIAWPNAAARQLAGRSTQAAPR